jgi:hypothetical protein
MVVLYEMIEYPELGILGFVIAFKKEAAIIAEDGRLDQTSTR